MGGALPGGLIFILLLDLRGALQAQPAAPAAYFAEPRPVSPADGRASQARLAVDPLGNAWIAMVVDGKVTVRIIGSTLSSERALPEMGVPQEDASIEVGARGQAFVAFLANEGLGAMGRGVFLPAMGREVFLSKSLAGSFGEASNLSRHPADERTPRLALDPTGWPRLVWARGTGDGPRLFHHDSRRGTVEDLGQGDLPSIAVDLQGFSHVAYVRDGLLLLIDQGAGGFAQPLEVDRGVAAEAPGPVVGVDAGGRLAITYLSGAELRLALREGGAFQPPRVLDPGLHDPPSSLEVSLSDEGRILAAYQKEGEVFLVGGAVDGPLVPVALTSTPGEESSACVREDPRGDLHLVFVREGDVYYANTAAPPRADFAADKDDGELPLLVEFEDHSVGEVQAWRWDFGDGSVSTERRPAHTYLDTGRYTVSLEVFGKGGTARVEKPGLVTVREPSHVLRVAEVPVFPGETKVWLPVIGEHRQPLQGFQVAGRFNANALFLRSLSLEATITDLYHPEFFVPLINNEEGYFTSGVILDYVPPYDGRRIAAGADHRLLYLVFDVLPDAPPGLARVELSEGIGESMLGCMFAVDGTSRIPVLRAGGLEVLDGSAAHPPPFLRGDTDRNLVVNLTDVVQLLAQLFRGTGDSICPDADDVDDSGDLDVSDLIYLLDFLFLSGSPLPLPYPGPGLDPTGDGLPPCEE